MNEAYEIFNTRTYNGELHVSRTNCLASELVNVFDPLMVALETVSRDTNDFGVSLGKVISTAGDLSELGRADRSKVTRMREQDGLYGPISALLLTMFR